MKFLGKRIISIVCSRKSNGDYRESNWKYQQQKDRIFG